MTEKVKVTKEQAEAIEEFQKTVHELGISSDELKGIFESGYEVKPEYEAWDWFVYIGKDGKVAEYIKKGFTGQVVAVYYGFITDGYHKFNNSDIRHATPEEIAEEKKRRWWAKHGREPWELRYNDTLICDKLPRIVDKIADLKKKTVIFTDGDWEYFDNVKEEYKVLVFAKDRLDVKPND